jgi:putative transposase
VLVQSKRNKHAALKLMRKLLKKLPSSPSDWSRTTCDHIAQRPALSAWSTCTSAGDGGTIGPKIRISGLDDESARCNVSSARSAQKFLSTHAAAYNIFSVQRHLMSAQSDRVLRAAALTTWRGCCGCFKFRARIPLCVVFS